MLRNYLIIAFRNLKRHKAFASLNIAGLSIGMACSILILLWVQDELSYDRFHAKSGQLYRITADAGEMQAAVTPAGMGPGLHNEMPEIKSFVRLSKPYTALFEVGNTRFEEKRVFYADSNFLQVFSFPLIKGNAATALQKPDGILITEAMAKKYFGKEEAVGKTIMVDHRESLIVTGVLAAIPSNSHLQFDFVVPMSNLARTEQDLKSKTWGNFNYYTYLELDKNAITSTAGLKKLNERIKEIYKARGHQMKIDFHLQPLTDIHLHSNLQIDLPGHGNVQYVNIFFVVALFILAVACINFMNLATARSARRAKEVGLRKVVGAARTQLIAQFLGEALIIAFLSLLLAIGLVSALLPAFNHLAEKHLTIDLSNGQLLGGLLTISLVTGLISGSYPALYLSGFKPVIIFKGKMKPGTGNLLFRNGLVVTQFVVSIILLAGTMIVYRQLNFIKSKNLGFDKSNLVFIPMSGEIWGKQQALKMALKQHPLTSDYTVVSDLPASLTTGTVDVRWEGKDPKSQVIIPNIDVDEHFIDVFKMKMLSGRNFSADQKSDTFSFVINEKAMQIMGMTPDNAPGKPLQFGDSKGTIIGVVKDFNFKPLQYAIEPLVLRLNKWGGLVVVRTAPGNTESTLKALQKIYRELNPSYPFTYDFVDTDLNNMYRGEQKMGSIFNVFALLAFFISCLGLYGLSAFMAEQRTKEIGVRKVLGASVFNIVYLLSRNFTKLILIAMAIGIPVSWIAIDNWLKGFAYRIDVGWTVFLAASGIALFIAWLTVSYESVKAAIVNPVKSLKAD